MPREWQKHLLKGIASKNGNPALSPGSDVLECGPLDHGEICFSGAFVR